MVFNKRKCSLDFFDRERLSLGLFYGRRTSLSIFYRRRKKRTFLKDLYAGSLQRSFTEGLLGSLLYKGLFVSRL